MVFALRHLNSLAIGFAIASVCTLPASAQLLDQKGISAGMAITMAQTAIDTCKASGYRVSVTVIGRAGEVILQVRGDNASPHTFENSQRKAYTARTFRMPSGDWATNLANDPNRGAQFLTGVIAIRGGLPVKVGDDVIGAIGVSGAPGGDKDEVCSKAAIDKIADQLK
jgi:uncharacterized protein GlcG (DUF336 family)